MFPPFNDYGCQSSHFLSPFLQNGDDKMFFTELKVKLMRKHAVEKHLRAPVLRLLLPFLSLSLFHGSVSKCRACITRLQLSPCLQTQGTEASLIEKTAEETATDTTKAGYMGVVYSPGRAQGVILDERKVSKECVLHHQRAARM